MKTLRISPAALLRDHALLRGTLGGAVAPAELASVADVVELRADEVVPRRPARRPALNYFVSGGLLAALHRRGSRTVAITLLRGGDIVDVPLPGAEPADEVRALVPALLVRLPSAHVEHLASQAAASPPPVTGNGWGATILRYAARRGDAASRALRRTLLPCDERLAELLLELADNASPASVPNIPQRALAQLVDMTRETMFRALGRLRERDLVRGRRPLLLPDVAALRSYAGGPEL